MLMSTLYTVLLFLDALSAVCSFNYFLPHSLVVPHRRVRAKNTFLRMRLNLIGLFSLYLISCFFMLVMETRMLYPTFTNNKKNQNLQSASMERQNLCCGGNDRTQNCKHRMFILSLSKVPGYKFDFYHWHKVQLSHNK